MLTLTAPSDRHYRRANRLVWRNSVTSMTLQISRLAGLLQPTRRPACCCHYRTSSSIFLVNDRDPASSCSIGAHDRLRHLRATSPCPDPRDLPVVASTGSGRRSVRPDPAEPRHWLCSSRSPRHPVRLEVTKNCFLKCVIRRLPARESAVASASQCGH